MKVNKDKPLLQACPRTSGMMHMSNLPFSEASFRTDIFVMYIGAALQHQACNRR